ncbi:MAG: serine/threonine-protein kinase, partial [Acidobacteriota bacterium]
RDLKPSNIVLETPADGPARPVVLDFGIARPVGGEGLTAPGQIVGTPAFMAPEQVQGPGILLDRRTDIYALGATLYSLLMGRPPHAGTGTPLLFKIIHDEPERLPQDHIPIEVEAIVFRCLEKDRARRYESARALAEDLGRYLTGEPVLARPVTRWVRLGKWLRRHRVAAQVSSAAALVAVAALTWGGWSALRSETRQEAARRFGAQVEEIEALARFSHLVPLHDARADRAQLRERLEAIRPSLEHRDPVVRALASQALGRGHLALDEPSLARGHLETAHRLDPENVEIAADLGRTLSELYRERLTTLERVRDRAAVHSTRRKLARDFKATILPAGEQRNQWLRTLGQPARELMDSGPLAPKSAELEALILFHDGGPEAALKRLAAASAAAPWVYERHRLEGDIRRSWAVLLADDGRPDDGGEAEARRQLEAARLAYGRALTVAPSHAAILRSDAQAAILLVRMALIPVEKQRDVLDQARDVLRKAQVVDPEGLETWLWSARLELAEADLLFDLALDPTEALAESLGAAQRATEIDGRSSAAWLDLAQTHRRLAHHLTLRGQDPTEDLEKAAAFIDRVEPAARDFSYFVHVGNLHMVIAGYRSEYGLDAAGAYRAATAAYREAAQLHTKPFNAYFGLGSALYRAASVVDDDPQRLIEEAIQMFEQALTLRPEKMETFYYLERLSPR